jgi:hypothetical protein
MIEEMKQGSELLLEELETLKKQKDAADFAEK